jgi:NagD protein
MASGSCGSVPDALDFSRVRGFMFDVDGTLVHRGRDGHAQPQPGAVDVLGRIRSSGRPLVLFTNASHVRSETIARGLTKDGLPVAGREVLTPPDSAIAFLRRHHAGEPALLFASEVIEKRFVEDGIPIAAGEDARVVFVAHQDRIEVAELERAARAIDRGAPLFTSSYVRGYAGANGIIYSRGAMITAAIAKVTGARPRVLGKPSRAAVDALSARLGVPSEEIAVIGDDLGMDVALGRLGGSRTVLVRSGISGAVALHRVPVRQRPDAVIDAVADLLAHL